MTWIKYNLSKARTNHHNQDQHNYSVFVLLGRNTGFTLFRTGKLRQNRPNALHAF